LRETSQSPDDSIDAPSVTVSATDEEILNATKEMMIKHADALEKLK
jgi:hypothetical protein